MFGPLFLSLFLVLGCEKSDPVTSRPQILVSIPPYRYFVERIAGPLFDVETIVPASANPHSFEPTPRRVAAMDRSQIWFRIGEPFEEKVSSILVERNPELVIADLREDLPLIEGECKCSIDHLDRHIWLSPNLAKEQSIHIEKILSQRFPEHADTFQKNLSHLLLELAALDEEIHALLKNIQGRTLLVSHPAFAYFCKDYGFDQLSVEYDGKDPRPKYLQEVLQRAISESATAVLALPQHNNKGVRLIAEKLHVPVQSIDPYSDNYFEMMRTLAHLIADAN